VVETTIGRPRRLLAPLVALLAVGLLVIMIVVGQSRENGQFVKFAPAGVMPESPGEIDRVEMTTSAGRWAFVRAPDGWRGAADGRPVPSALASRLDDSIKFMHVSAPIRVMERAEWSPIGLREFGLDPPGYTATLYRRGLVVLGAEFGTPNPQQVLQYMKLEGRDQVFLMSRFVGEEWERALRGATGG
jgi:hypothetical protein